jgi:hypothetical protein
MPSMDAMELRDLIRSSWSAETAMGEWSPVNPSLNQCAVTALVVQDLLGGKLLRCQVTDGGSHYWNKLPDGTELDLCADQFRQLSSRPKKETTEERSRQTVLSFPSTMRRYGKLLQSVAAGLQAKTGQKQLPLVQPRSRR